MERTSRLLYVDRPGPRRRQFVADLARHGVDIVAAEPKNCVNAFRRCKPDLVVFDVSADEVDLRALKTLLRSFHNVVAVGDSGAESTALGVIAVLAGALDYLPVRGRDEAPLDAELVWAQIGAHCQGTPVSSRRVAAEANKAPRLASVVAIGVSTGGPVALGELLSTLPESVSCPILIAQHMPAGFTSQLATTLGNRSPFRVREAWDGADVSEAQVWIAKGDHHLLLHKQGARTILRLEQSPRRHGVRPAADHLFRSTADIYGARTLGVVLTGMGCDGVEGCRHIRHCGGQILVQDKHSSVVWGMAGAVARAGLAHQHVSLRSMGAEIAARAVTNARLGSTVKP